MTEQRPTRLAGFTRVYTVFGTALGILMAMGLGGMAMENLLENRVRSQTHAYYVLSRANDFNSHLNALEAAHRGFVAVGDAHFLQEYNQRRDSINKTLADLHGLSSDNPAQLQRLASLDSLIAARITYIDAANSMRSRGDAAGAANSLRLGSQSSLRSDLRTQINAVTADERSLLTTRNARLLRTMRGVKSITIAGLGLSALLVALSVWLIRIEIARRRKAKRELAASEERLRDFLDTATDLIQSSTADGRIVYANRALLETLDYRASEVIGRNSEMFFAPEERAKGDALFARIIAGETVTDIDTVYMRKDGRRIHVIGSSSCRFENGVPVATRTILHDVTRQREVDNLKDEFVSIVSHELRTPLTSIRGALGLLAGGMLGDIPERGKRMLDVAIANTDRLVRLINDILDVERIASGAVPMSRRRVSLAAILKEVDDVMQPIAHKAGITLAMGTLDVDLNADSDRIVQTMVNLVSNAVKFSPSGTTVRVEAAREPDHVHIRVSDEGRGIPAHMLETVFARFQQVDASDAREKGGSGLGLAISRGIIDQHEGQIWAAGALDYGAVFHILLPILPPALPLFEPDAVNSMNEDGPLILICDDEADVRTVLSRQLLDRGYRVISAADGEAAIAMAIEHHPEVMLLDLVMPGGMDGWATMAQLKEHTDTRDIPIIIVSGSDRAVAAAPDPDGALVRKPVDEPSLMRAIEHALAQWGANADVLVVEDDPDLARILLEFLRSHGLRPVHAADGRAAVRLSQRVDPSLIILDLNLPDTDGFAVVDWLRQHDRLSEVPILVYSASDLDEEQRARLDIAPELLFTKSRMPPGELVEKVAAMVGRITLDHEKAR